MRAWLCSLVLAGVTGVAVSAHHSFAVFFDDTKVTELSGTVTSFRFTNPHGEIAMTVRRDGREETWKIETNAPTLLRRRGWTRESLKAGDEIKVVGWLARDGRNYVRMRTVTRADGTVLGAPVVNQRTDPSGERR
jgi:hypothetical protein